MPNRVLILEQLALPTRKASVAVVVWRRAGKTRLGDLAKVFSIGRVNCSFSVLQVVKRLDDLCDARQASRRQSISGVSSFLGGDFG
jgi:hypothetical protein